MDKQTFYEKLTHSSNVLPGYIPVNTHILAGNKELNISSKGKRYIPLKEYYKVFLELENQPIFQYVHSSEGMSYNSFMDNIRQLLFNLEEYSKHEGKFWASFATLSQNFLLEDIKYQKPAYSAENVRTRVYSISSTNLDDSFFRIRMHGSIVAHTIEGVKSNFYVDFGLILSSYKSDYINTPIVLLAIDRQVIKPIEDISNQIGRLPHQDKIKLLVSAEVFSNKYYKKILNNLNSQIFSFVDSIGVDVVVVQQSVLDDIYTPNTVSEVPTLDEVVDVLLLDSGELRQQICQQVSQSREEVEETVSRIRSTPMQEEVESAEELIEERIQSLTEGLEEDEYPF